ncbi:hypothetical protein [Roseiarcus fermentans]|uniref:hypothetical protein n=1 Tax=Roseiarcus fermentans TaxID=1473586 RepID=UPI0011BE8BFC|nr:hypothetical protein [Roseiarcus fermentans]
MKRAKSNRQIVEEFFMRRRVDDPLSDDWKEVVDGSLDQLIRTLKYGMASAQAQSDAARLLEELTLRSRGRTKKLLPTTKFEGLSWFVDYQEGLHAARGHNDPLGAALEDAREAERSETGAYLSSQTIRDYYRKGVTARGPGDSRFAQTIDAAAERLASEGISDPLREAMAREANGDPVWEHVNRKAYDRGRRRLARSREKK